MTRTLLAVLGFILVGCGRPADTQTRTIPIGVVTDITGNNSEPSWVDSMQLAKEHANAGLKISGQLAGVGFNLLFADSQNEPTLAEQRCEKLVTESKVKALVLDTSQVDLQVNRRAYDADPSNDLNVPLQCGSCTSGSMNNPAATDPDPVTQAALRNGLKWNWRSIMSSKLISKILVELLLKTNASGDTNGDGKFKIAFLGSDEVFGRGAAKDLKAFAVQFVPTPAPIVEEIYHPQNADPNSYDWPGVVQQLVDNQTAGVTDGVPDAVVVANFAEQQAALLKAYRQNGTKVPLLHYHTLRIKSVLQSLGSLAEGAKGVSHVLLSAGPSGDAFSSLYQKRYSVPVVYRDSIYYDNVMTLELAAVIASINLADPTQVTGQQIRDALPLTSVAGGEIIRPGPEEFARAVGLIKSGKPINYEGASGPMDYDAYGNVVQVLAEFQASGGDFVDIAKFDCVQSALCPQQP